MSINAMSKFHFWSTVGSTIWLAILAGCLNAFTTVALLHERASHLSGRATDLGKGFMAYFVYPDGIARTKLFEEALIISIITASFIAGATLGAKLMRTIGLGKAIMIVGVLIGISSIMVLVGFPAGARCVFSFERAVWALILPFAMGIQNASTTLTSLGRTTHVTGTLTDLGIAISNREHKNAIRLFSMWTGFTVGGSAGFLTFFYIPSLFTQLAILTAAFIITGSSYAHPAVARKLSPVVGMREAQH